MATVRWSSGFGFILATIGAAVGLGNIWRFSAVVGQNGGGAYLVPYLIAAFVCVVPIVVTGYVCCGVRNRAGGIGQHGRRPRGERSRRP